MHLDLTQSLDDVRDLLMEVKSLICIATRTTLYYILIVAIYEAAVKIRSTVVDITYPFFDLL